MTKRKKLRTARVQPLFVVKKTPTGKLSFCLEALEFDSLVDRAESFLTSSKRTASVPSLATELDVFRLMLYGTMWRMCQGPLMRGLVPQRVRVVVSLVEGLAIVWLLRASTNLYMIELKNALIKSIRP